MEHKKFLKLEEIISDYTDDEEATRELALEIADFLEIENKNPLNIITERPLFWDKLPLYTPRGNECINNPRA